MTSLCVRGVLALLCLTCVTSYVQSEDNIGQNRFDEDDDDGFYRHGRQFYRFGRAFWDNDEDSLIRKAHLVHWPGYPISPSLDNDAFSRNNREFYRFGRSYPPYQDKRFLRFGRAHQSDNDDYNRAVLLQSDEPLYRKRRSSVESQSAGSSQHSDEKINVAGKDLQKRETPTAGTKSGDNLSYNAVLDGENDLDKRFMRFGKRFMRFGRGDGEDDGYDKRFMRFGKSVGDDQDYEKRFMRFGKRFMRFGRGDEEDESEDKRFMRFGKRFMRFGKRFMRFGRGYEDDDSDSSILGKDVDDKRFMRFGKRSKRASSTQLSSNSEASAAL